jgi:hypothetical protein
MKSAHDTLDDFESLAKLGNDLVSPERQMEKHSFGHSGAENL